MSSCNNYPSSQFPVTLLCKKYREAAREEPESALFLSELEEGLPPRLYEEWRKKIESAEENRLNNPEGMLLYLPSIDHGNFQSIPRNATDAIAEPGLGAQADNLQKERPVGTRWLLNAIRLEEEQ